MMAEADIICLEKLADRIDRDALEVNALHPAMMRSIADIIRRAIGAPVVWPTRDAGVAEADRLYSGSPALRLAFNHGVKWAVTNHGGSEPIEYRYPKRDSAASLTPIRHGETR